MKTYLVALLAVAPGVPALFAQNGSHLNVILISMDQCRADELHVYGNSRQTSPNLDRIASAGVRFSRFYSASPWTTPSYGAIMTSQYPSRHGATLLVQNGAGGIRSGTKLVAQLFHEAGYHTGAFVNNSVAGAFLTRPGFDDYDEAQRRPTNITERSTLGNETFKAPATNQRVFQWIDTHSEKPFFLFVLYFEPHSPYDPPPEDDIFRSGKYANLTNTGYNLEKGNLFRLANLGDADAIARLQQLYDGKIHFVDRYVGQLYDYLRKKGLDKNTVVWITSDHGELLYSHRDDYMTFDHRSLYDQVMHVPGIVVGPGVPKGKVIDAVTTHIDITPTILDLVGLAPKGDAQGKSLVPLVSRKTTSAHQYVFGEQDVHEKLRSVRNARYKLIWNEDTGKKQLFDDVHDPAEHDDVASQNPAVVRELTSVLEDWRKENELPASVLRKRWEEVAQKSEATTIVDEVTIGARFQLIGSGWKMGDDPAAYGGGMYWAPAAKSGDPERAGIWRSDNPFIGRYRIAIWYGKLSAPGSPKAKFKVLTRGGKTKMFDVDESNNVGKWNVLGEFEDPMWVRMEMAPGAPMVADAVRFERIGD